MSIETLAYTVVLALINFPVVAIVDAHARSRPVHKVYALEPEDGQRRREQRNALVTTPIHALLFLGFIESGWILRGSESLLLAIGTFLLTFAWTEIWHYASHLAMHHRWLHAIHREHHKSRLTTAWTSVSFSLGEKFTFSVGILGFVALASRLHPLSEFGIFAYYILYFVTNTLGHANFEIRAPEYRKSFMGRIFNSPAYHAMHHARYIRNYGLLTPWLDQLFGTVWEDESDVQTRAARSQPLTRLSERSGQSDFR